MNLKKQLMIATLVTATGLFSAPGFTADEANTVPGLTAAGAPLGLHGIDPVAFVELNNRTAGKAAYTAVHEDVAYYFSSEDNMKIFQKHPSRYVPQNGGFCTFGVSVGKKFDGNPRYAAVEDGKLYVFLNEDIFREFQKDKTGTIAKARQQWSSIKHVAASKL